MIRILNLLGSQATWVLFIGIFAGLLFPDLAGLLRPLLGPTVVALLLITLLRVDWQAMLHYARRPGLWLVLTFWLLLASPVAVWLSLGLVGPPQSLATALVLMAAAPPILSATSLAIQLGLDGPLAIVASLASVLLAPLTVAPLSLYLLGLELDVGVGEFMLRLGVIIGLAFLGAAVVRKLAGRPRLKALAKPLDGAIVVIMLLFGIAIMEGVTEALFARPAIVALWLAAAFIANPALQLAGMLAFAWLGRRAALTVGLLTGNANMGLLLAALPADADRDVMLYFAVAQLPIFMLPAVLLPLYRRLLTGEIAGQTGSDHHG